jgi:hypothetical protein
MELGVDFVLRDDMISDNLIPVELRTGKFSGVVYEYQDMQIVESPNADEPHILQFKFKILNPAEHNAEELEENQTFKETIGLILNHMIITVMEADIANAARENNINQSDTE